MTSQSDNLQTLAAGYVLGDLSSEEMAAFQARLATDAALAQTVADLQETLTLLPYGLPQQQPDARLKAQLLTRATASPRRLTPRLPAPAQWRKRALPVGLAVMTGLSLLLAYRVTRLQTQLALRPTEYPTEHPTEYPTEQIKVADESAVTVYPAEAMLAQQWTGLAELVQDHTGSLTRSQGPVDIQADQPRLLSQALAVDLMPSLVAAQAELLGGSPCQFEKAKGVRLTYQLPQQQTVSVYQIDLNGDQFPELLETHVTLTYNNVNLILWRENNYLYAIAASMPVSQLETLIESLEFI